MSRFKLFFAIIVGVLSNSFAQNNTLLISNAQETDFKSLSYLLISNSGLSSQNVSDFENRLNDHLEGLQIKKGKLNSDKKFLEYLFFKTHKEFLKKYEKYSDFSTMLTLGNYDCLSGSLLFGYLLDKLGYEYNIVETLYHVYVLVTVNGNTFLLESTDPMRGFVSSSNEIQERVTLYTTGESLTNKKILEGISSNEYQFESKAVANIGLKEAGALQFYNLSIVDFNNQKLTSSYLKLELALQYYPSSRIEEMLAVVVQNIARSEELSLHEKTYFLQKFKAYHRAKTLANH